jgi:type II secretory pathway pseudopilin PulG
MQSGNQSGFTYIGLMIFIVIAGIGMAGTGTIASVQLQREKEMQLLFVGEQFSKAIESYYLSTPTALKMFPATFQELLEDKRFPKPRRHLRQVYFDPMTGKQEWGLIMLGGRIIGVHSLSARKPRKTAGFPEHQAEFAKAKNYREWRFTYLDPTQAAANIPNSRATSFGQ